MHGDSVPFHVQHKTWGQCHNIRCESLDCQRNADIARRSNLSNFRCVHLKSIDYCSSTAKETYLREDVLDDMVSKRWFGEDKKKECLRHLAEAQENNIPFTVSTSLTLLSLCVSVYELSVAYYSRLQCVIVVYNRRTSTLNSLYQMRLSALSALGLFL